MLEYLGRRLQLEDEIEEYLQAHSKLSPLQLWQQVLRNVVLSSISGQIVIFVDEIDMIRNLDFSTDEFFAAIRACYNARAEDETFSRLNFCLIGVATPADLISDPRLTPFNIGTRIELGDFSREEASLLEHGLGKGTDTNRRLMDRIYHWTGGHPYLTQQLCKAVAQDEANLTDRQVDGHCERLFLSAKAQRQDNNLSFVQKRILADEDEKRAGILTLYAKILSGIVVEDNDTTEFVSDLKLAGIVRALKGQLQISNRIYASVFDRAWSNENLPGAEQRRQRAAYRQGIVRALTLSGVVMISLLALGFYGFYQFKQSKQNAALYLRQKMEAQHLLYIANMNLIPASYERNDFARIQALLDETRVIGEYNFEWGYWNRVCHRELLTLKGQTDSVYSDTPRSAVFSPDSKRILTIIDNIAKVWDAQSGRELLTLKGQTDSVYSDTPRSAVFSPDGKRILTGSWDNTAKVWDAQSGREIFTLKGHSDAVLSVTYSPDGKRILTASADNTAKVWDAQSGHELLTLKEHSERILSVAYSPDSKRILTIIDNTAKVWDALSGRELLTLKGHSVNSAVFSPDSKRILTGSWDNTAKVWDAQSGRELHTLKGQTDCVNSAVFSPDSKRILTIIDKTAKVWDVFSGHELFTLRGHTESVASVAYSPDGKRILTASADNTAKVWDALSGHELLTLKGHTKGINSAVFSPDGKRILTSGSDNTAKVWDAFSGHELFTLKGHSERILSVAYSPDGKRILTGSDDKTSKIWDALSGRELLTLRGHAESVKSAVFSPDGKRILTGSDDKTAKVWISE